MTILSHNAMFSLNVSRIECVFWQTLYIILCFYSWLRKNQLVGPFSKTNSFVILFRWYLIRIFVSLECPVGLYGDHCNNNCGNCLNNTTCHHVNGTCFEGCEPGYQEHNCTEGKHLYREN